jgi:hypothetical protein
MSKRFTVTADVEGVGEVQHLVTAPDKDAARAKLGRAYAGKEITSFRARERLVEIEGQGS